MAQQYVRKFGASLQQRWTLESRRKTVKPLEPSDIGLREASRYYRISTRTRNRTWKSCYLL